MFKLLLHLFLVRFVFSSDSGDILDALNLKPALRQQSLSDSTFPRLNIYHVNAKMAKTSKYPWIAKVIHSRNFNIPHMCTAICIEEAIYITAAKCIYSLKVNYTTIHHMSKKFEAVAFVVPSKPTKQMFDDIGIIVVDKNKVKGVKWETIILSSRTKRTDKNFAWSSKLDTQVGKLNYMVVGYALDKFMQHSHKIGDTIFVLRELDVTVSHDICANILEHFRRGKGYKVPCYHSCTFQEYLKGKVPKCNNYLGVEGAALIEIGKPNKLVGVATWGIYEKTFELPVGISVVNSENFFKDLSCARRIRGDKGVNVKKDYYQKLCNSKL